MSCAKEWQTAWRTETLLAWSRLHDWNGSRELLAAAATADKTLIEYDAGHNLLAEERTLHAVRRDYLQWLETRADASWASSML